MHKLSKEGRAGGLESSASFEIVSDFGGVRVEGAFEFFVEDSVPFANVVHIGRLMCGATTTKLSPPFVPVMKRSITDMDRESEWCLRFFEFVDHALNGGLRWSHLIGVVLQ